MRVRARELRLAGCACAMVCLQDAPRREGRWGRKGRWHRFFGQGHSTGIDILRITRVRRWSGVRSSRSRRWPRTCAWSSGCSARVRFFEEVAFIWLGVVLGALCPGWTCSSCRAWRGSAGPSPISITEWAGLILQVPGAAKCSVQQCCVIVQTVSLSLQLPAPEAGEHLLPTAMCPLAYRPQAGGDGCMTPHLCPFVLQHSVPPLHSPSFCAACHHVFPCSCVSLTRRGSNGRCSEGDGR